MTVRSVILGSLVLVATSFSSQRRYARKFRQHGVSMRSSVSEASHMSLPLSGKTAFITGSSGGIGKAIATTFAAAGADVILHYNLRKDGAVNACEEINNAHKDAISRSSGERGDRNNTPGRCLGVMHADFRSQENVHDMFHSILDDILEDKQLDILINNAGIVTKLAVEDDDDDLSVWHETMSVNLHAPLQLMRLAHSHMKSKGGVIINNSSIHGSRSVEWMNAYAASKAALDSLTRGLALEYAADSVRVNAIAPGVVPVERTAHLFSDQNIVDLWTPHLPVGRLGNVQDIADATLLLATNDWMTGSILTVDGGMMARANMPIRPRPA